MRGGAARRFASDRQFHRGSQPAEATCREVVESTCIFNLTKLPPLTCPLITEELRPEDTPRGRFSFPTSRIPILTLASPSAHRYVTNHQSQNRTDAAKATTERNTLGHLSSRVAIRHLSDLTGLPQSFRPENAGFSPCRSTLLTTHLRACRSCCLANPVASFDV